MEQLWAPWRLSYVAAEKPPTAEDACFICRGLSEQEDKRNLIVQRREHCTVILNRFPYNNGHLLVAPLRHIGEFTELNADELLQSMQTIQNMIALLRDLMKPEGFNVGLNLGRVAGAGLPGHVHWHIVPRWNGDTNFMPVISDTNVIVQALDAAFDMLVENLAKNIAVKAIGCEANRRR